MGKTKKRPGKEKDKEFGKSLGDSDIDGEILLYFSHIFINIYFLIIVC